MTSEPSNPDPAYPEQLDGFADYPARRVPVWLWTLGCLVVLAVLAFCIHRERPHVDAQAPALRGER